MLMAGTHMGAQFTILYTIWWDWNISDISGSILGISSYVGDLGQRSQEPLWVTLLASLETLTGDNCLFSWVVVDSSVSEGILYIESSVYS